MVQPFGMFYLSASYPIMYMAIRLLYILSLFYDWIKRSYMDIRLLYIIALQLIQMDHVG